MRCNDLKKGKHRADLIQALLSGDVCFGSDEAINLWFLNASSIDHCEKLSARSISLDVHFARGTLLRCFRVTTDDTWNISAKEYTEFPMYTAMRTTPAFRLVNVSSYNVTFSYSSRHFAKSQQISLQVLLTL